MRWTFGLLPAKRAPEAKRPYYSFLPVILALRDRRIAGLRFLGGKNRANVSGQFRNLIAVLLPRPNAHNVRAIDLV
jgi:hypothetical protein